MAYPKVVAAGSATAASGHAAGSGQTVSGQLNPKTGDSLYVFVSYQGGLLGPVVSGVSDTSSNLYKRAARKQNNVTSPYPAVDVWYSDNVPSNSTLQVTVTFSSNTVFAFYAIDIAGAAPTDSLDALSAGQESSAKSSSDSIASIGPNDLVMACQASANVTGSSMSSGGGFTATELELESGTSTSDVLLDVWQDGPASPNDFNSSLSWTDTAPYSIVTIAIRSAVAIGGVPGAPHITVSSVGVANSYSPILNGGADFGPDTAGTTTCGLQEALNYLGARGGGTLKLCTAGTDYSISSKVTWPSGGNGIKVSGIGWSKQAGGLNSNGTRISASGTFSDTDMITFDSNDFYNVSFEEFTMDGLNGSVTNSLLNLATTTEIRHEISLYHVAFCSTGTASPTYGLIMDHDQESVLLHCNHYLPFEATITGGSLKVFGGNMLWGCELAVQDADFFGVAFNNSSPSGGAAVTINSGGGSGVSIGFYSCYWDDPMEASSPSVSNNSGGRVNVVAYGCRFFQSNNNTFFAVSGTSPYNLELAGCTFNVSAGYSCSVLDTTLDTHNLTWNQTNVLSPTGGTATLETSKSQVGLGNPNVQLLSGQVALVAANGTTVLSGTSWTDPLDETDPRVTVSIYVRITAFVSGGTITFELDYYNYGNVEKQFYFQMQPQGGGPIVSALSAGSTGEWSSIPLPLRIKAGTTLELKQVNSAAQTGLTGSVDMKVVQEE
jgi:hypothetical protein